MDTRSIWERTNHAFERILEDSQKATERVMSALEELGEKTKLRVERARLTRSLLKRSAELGSRVYELCGKGSASAQLGAPLDDSVVKALLQDLARLDEELKKCEAQIARD